MPAFFPTAGYKLEPHSAGPVVCRAGPDVRGVWYLPKSPRCLLQKNRFGEAMLNPRLLGEGRFSGGEIEGEFSEHEVIINNTVQREHFKELFQDPRVGIVWNHMLMVGVVVNLKRTWFVIGTNVFLQLTGHNFTSVCGTYFIRTIGVVNRFTTTSVNTTINIVMTLVTQSLTDVVGRIPLMLASATVQTGVLFTMGGLGTNPDPLLSVKTGIVAMVTVFGVGFQLGWAPLAHVIAAEVPTQRLRDKTYAVGSVFNIVIQFLVSFSVPYLLNAEYAGLGSRVGFLFGSTAFGAVLFTWFCMPECSGRTLEEIDRLFLRGTAIRDFGKAGRVLDEDAVEVRTLEGMKEPGRGSQQDAP
ncbi:general substrate transporter [Apiospora marii]|uniref:General substrate transporter n=1 Tax=Apiospora marii TaxID=335849 RepID=A0ABR1SN39_9PEZI